MRRSILATLGHALILLSPLTAQDHWVDASSGDDLGPGTAASPLRTITAAVARAAAHSVVHILPGTYDSASGEVFPIQILQPLVLRGHVVSGARPVIDAGAATTELISVGADDTTIEDVDLRRQRSANNLRMIGIAQANYQNGVKVHRCLKSPRVTISRSSPWRA